MAKQKKSNSTGRFGARYGVRIRRRVRDIESRQRQKHRCPQCGFEKVKRQASGIWQCRKCDHKFAGGAYVPETPGYKASQRQLKEALARDEDEFAEDEGEEPTGVLDEGETVVPSVDSGEAGGPEEPEVDAEEELEAPEDTEVPEPEGPGASRAERSEGREAPEELTPEERVFEDEPEEASDEPAPESEEPAPEELIPSESEEDEAEKE